MIVDSKTKLLRLIANAEQLEQAFEALQPLKPEDEARLWKKLRLEWNYNSNHIEGNTLTYTETELLLIFDKTDGGHTMRELEEMKAHDVAVRMIKEWASEDRPLSETDIRTLNATILHTPFWKEAMTPDGQATRRLIKIGVYKEQPNSVRLQNGEMFHYASPAETPRMMTELVDWYRAQAEMHPIELAAELHYRFIRIHPFDDGNGRVARLLMNLVLMKAGYPPLVIKTAEKKQYLDALQRADAGDMTAFYVFLAGQAIWSLELGIRAGKGEDIEEREDLNKEIHLLTNTILYEVKKTKNPESILHVFIHVFTPFYNVVLAEAEKLQALFRDNQEIYFVNGQVIEDRMWKIFASIEKLTERFSEQFDQEPPAEKYSDLLIWGKDPKIESIKTIQWTYKLSGLRNQDKVIQCKLTVMATFNEDEFSVSTWLNAEKIEIQNLFYGENLSPYKIDMLVDGLKRTAIEFVKSVMKKEN